ncbi:MAG: 50S ribosomal protein L6 [Defluviitaleaceae bacterium]|nr:50S ribosomal protein L6 [Defluviitaleaceae bacterium]
MSRIGRMPITIPAGVEVKLENGNFMTVKGPKGTLSRQLTPEITITIDNGVMEVTRPNDLKKYRSLHGLTRTLIDNMVVGVTVGYKKSLEIIGTGYRAAKAGNKLTLTLGYSHPVEMEDPEGIASEVEGNTKIHVSGIDKEKVGQYAANIRAKRAPEPYKGKGIRYQGEQVRRKAGKSGKK